MYNADMFAVDLAALVRATFHAPSRGATRVNRGADACHGVLTTEAMIAELPEPQTASEPGSHHHHGI